MENNNQNGKGRDPKEEVHLNAAFTTERSFKGDYKGFRHWRKAIDGQECDQVEERVG